MSAQVFCWGDNSSGQLGPEVPPELGPRSWELRREATHISCGEHHTLVLSRVGTVQAYGRNSHGQLGYRTEDSQIDKSRTCQIDLSEVIATLACGRNHCLAVASSCGQVYSWGAKEDGQLGILRHKWLFNDKPTVISLLGNVPVVQVSCGDSHSLALTQGGDVYSWGSNSHGQLGQGKSVTMEYQPRLVQAMTGIPVTQISAGAAHTLVLTLTNWVYCCGANDHGQLGLNRVDKNGRFNIRTVPALGPIDVSSISCGESHSAALTKDGKVYTFGKGSDGQLGNDSISDELRPHLVSGLDGPASQIACGRHHTLVLGCSGQVWAFGNGDKGQMGNGKAEGSRTPSLVKLPWIVDRSAAVPKDLKIAAGWNSNFVFMSSGQDPELCQISGRLVQKKLQKWLTMKSSDEQAVCEISWIFFSNSSLVASFTKESLVSPEEGALTVDLELAVKTYEELLAVPWIKSLVNIYPALYELKQSAASLRSPEVIILLLLLPILAENSNVIKMTCPVAVVISELSENTSDKLKSLWRSLSPALFSKQVLVLKNALVYLLKSGFQKAEGLKHVLKALKLLYQANKTGNLYKVPRSLFHVEEMSRIVDLYVDVRRWLCPPKAEDNSTTPVIFCQYPFVFDLICKAGVFTISATISKGNPEKQLNLLANGLKATPHVFQQSVQQQLVVEHSIRKLQLGEQDAFRTQLIGDLLLKFNQLVIGREDTPPQIFQLCLRRNHLVEDTFRHLRHADHEAFKRELVVVFVEDRSPSMVNTKDFFYEIFKERKESGMYMYGGGNVAWFPPKPTVEEKDYFFLGVLCGLAMYNHYIIDLPFPLALFKKLRGIKPTLDDLVEYEPGIGRGMRCVLEEYGAKDFEKMASTFTIKWDGEIVSLDPKDPDKRVTPSNKEQFVAAYVDHVFNKSVERVFEEFKKGFYKVCDHKVVALFQPEELQVCMLGTEDYDWATFKQNTLYGVGYYQEHPNILTFWQVFEELSEDQKRKFLCFVTGSEKVHYLGMKNVQMTVELLLESVNIHFPQSLTCHCILRLPIYQGSNAKEYMSQRLLEALSTSQEASDPEIRACS